MQLLSRIRLAVLLPGLLGLAAPLTAQRMPPRPAPPAVRPRPPRPFVLPPQVPPKSPEQVRNEMRNTLDRNPHEVFPRLNSQAQVLPWEERVKLANEAAARLATRVEVSTNRWDTLNEVLKARQDAESFDPALAADLGVLAGVAERRVLADIVFEVGHLAEGGRWEETVRRGQEWQKRLRQLYQERTDGQSLRTHRDTLEPLAAVIRLGQERAALDALQEALRTGGVERATATDLPAALHDDVEGLRGLKAVRDLADEKRLAPREIASLKQSLDAFLKVQRTLPDADAALGGKLLQELAVRHLLQGHTTEYRALMPPDGPADHAAVLLRDVKALALGKGEVVTAPARAVLMEVDKQAEPPAGIRAIIPEEGRKNWRSPALGTKAEASALEKAGLIGKTVRTRIETNLESERITLADRAKEGQRRLTGARRRLQEREEADGKRRSEVESLLGRPVEAREKIIVWRMASEKQTNRQIADALKKQMKPDDGPKNPR